jgi:hypothetical protein
MSLPITYTGRYSGTSTYTSKPLTPFTAQTHTISGFTPPFGNASDWKLTYIKVADSTLSPSNAEVVLAIYDASAWKFTVTGSGIGIAQSVTYNLDLEFTFKYQP